MPADRLPQAAASAPRRTGSADAPAATTPPPCDVTPVPAPWGDTPPWDDLTTRGDLASLGVRVAAALLCVAASAVAQQPHLARYGAGDGPRAVDGVLHLLDAARTPGQDNAAAFDVDGPLGSGAGALESFTLRGTLRVDEGGEGGAFAFLATDRFGERGPGPFLPLVSAPDLPGTLAVGVDVHNPPSDEPFGPWGNYQGLPQREVSLHWDGRELVKRVAPVEFRGDPSDVEIGVRHVAGGAEVTVILNGGTVYDREFVPTLLPYRWRLAVAAGTRDDATTVFDVADLSLERGPPAAPRRPPLTFEVFRRVLTDNSTTSYEAEVDLPPASWAFGRVLLTLQIHDAGEAWDEWDRNGDLYVQAADGTWLDIVPFITSYRTECHWVVDVTDLRPLLTGPTRFRIAAGTTFYKNRGYEMSVDLAFHHGAAVLSGGPRDGEALAPWRVTPLWNIDAGYGTDQAPFAGLATPFELPLDASTAAARLRVTTTGHSQVGEFSPSDRSIAFTADVAAPGEPAVFSDTLWKTDCYLNPNRPQFGTWKYSRAGWAPGDVVRPWWVELTPHLVPGATARIAYRPEPYDFDDGERPSPGELKAARHVVRGFLIEYRPPVDALPAPTLRITGVSAGSAAATAGIAVGDYLALYDGRIVDSSAELGAAKAAALEAGKERVWVVLYRGSERLELEMASGQLGVNLGAG